MQPYYDDEQLREKLQSMPRDSRIRWHARRIKRERLVYRILDDLRQVDAVDEETLVGDLLAIRAKMKLVKIYMRLRQNMEFLRYRKKQLHCIRAVQQLAQERLEDTLISGSDSKARQRVVQSIRQEDILLDMASAYEVQLEKICCQYDVSVRPFLEVCKVLKRTRGVTTKSLTKEALGYEH